MCDILSSPFGLNAYALLRNDRETYSLVRQTPLNASAKHLASDLHRARSHFFPYLPSAPTDDDDGEAALHFLALPWAGPVEGSARGA
jgi:hypothetical protein